MVRTATAVKAGLLRRLRTARRTSAQSTSLRRCGGRKGYPALSGSLGRMRSCAVLALALLLFAGSAPTVDRETALSALLKGLVADGEPGPAGPVREDGRTGFERGAGGRGPPRHPPIDPPTPFPLASRTQHSSPARSTLLALPR